MTLDLRPNDYILFAEYSQFFLTKHFSTLLRTNALLAYELPSPLLRKIIDNSLFYIVDGNKDVEAILQFTADTWADKNICSLFKKSQQTIDSCSAFDYQIIPQMAEFLKQVDPQLDYKCKLIKGDEVTSKSIFKQSKVRNQDNNKQLNDTFAAGVLEIKQRQFDDFDINQWKPSHNIIKEIANMNSIFDTKNPQYTTKIVTSTYKADFEKNKGITIFSKPFDFSRRSWLLKVDIDYDNNMSLYLIERGAPMSLSKGSLQEFQQIGINIPLNFSSILMQFEITDPAFGDYQSTIFFSYSHDQHQVIGHSNMINLSQLQNKEEINIKVHLKEFILHSALTHYMSSHFQDLYQGDLRQFEENKKTSNLTYNNCNFKEYDIFDLKFYNIYQLLLSNHLKVEDENTVLGFIFHYTKVQSIKNCDVTMAYITELFVQNLRFQYLTTGKIISALRDNEYFRESSQFISKVREEFTFRIQHNQPLILNVNSSKVVTKENQRKHYDLSKISMQGRKKLETQKDKQPYAIFIEELMEWLQKSKHNKKQEDGLHQEIRKPQNLYYEEKKKAQDLQGTKAVLESKIEALIEVQERNRFAIRSQSTDIYEHDLGQFKDRLIQQKNAPPQFLQQRAKSPVKGKTPFFLNNNDSFNIDKKPAVGGFRQMNNSFDESLFFSKKNRLNESIRINGGSTAKADKKIRNNNESDFTKLLNNLNRSPQAIKSESYVPYYRQTKNQSQVNSKDSNKECAIF